MNTLHSLRISKNLRFLLVVVLLAITSVGSVGAISVPAKTVEATTVGSWITTGSLLGGRGDHVAILLSNGKVLVASGYTSGYFYRAANLYDPATGAWARAGSLSEYRTNPTATLLLNGNVLVAGGWGSGRLPYSTEMYNPATNTWTTTGSLTETRSFHTATLLPDGKVLVAGGVSSNGFRASAEQFNPGTGVWTMTASLLETRGLHTATLLPNGNVLIVGGKGNGYLASAELYDPIIDLWTTTGSLTTARSRHTALLLPNGQVLVVGGQNNTGRLATAELYDPATGIWTSTGSLVQARSIHTATLLSDGKVLVVGGDGTSGKIACAELYDPTTGAWTSTSSMAEARSNHTATLLTDGKVLVAGGYSSGYTGIASAELYDIDSDYATKVGLVTDAGDVDDMSFNWLAYQGLQQAETDLGIQGTLYESASSDDYLLLLQQCADDGNEFCFAVGFSMAAAILSAANANPDTQFAILDSPQDSGPSNLRSILFDHKQAGYLTGSLAGKMTGSNVVGTISGLEIPPVVAFVEGYRNGAQCANPDASVLIEYTGTFTDPSLGATTAQDMIDQGAEVIFGAAGATGNGAILHSAQQGIWSIGVDADQYLSVFGDGTVAGSDKLLTSAMKNLNFAVYQTIQDYLDESFSPGTVIYHLEDGGVGLAPYHETDASIPQSVKEYVDSVVADIISGNINIDNPCRHPPVAQSDSYETDEDTPLTVPAPGVLGNDSDPDNDPITAVLATDVSNGLLALNSDGSLTYTPDLNYFGTDSFTYFASDGELDSEETEVTITVNPVNDLPIVDAGGPYSGDEGAPIALSGASASDPDMDKLTYHWVVNSPLCKFKSPNLLKVILTCSDNGNFALKFSVYDGINPVVSKKAYVTVNNVAPSVNIDSIADGELFVLVGLDVNLLSSFSDPGADTHSTVIDWGDGSEAFDPALSPLTASHVYQVAGEYTVSVTVTDDDGGVGAVSASINIIEPAEATQDVIDEIDTILNDPNLDPEVVDALEDALVDLEGNNGGQGNNGAIDKLDGGNWNAALLKIKKAIKDLENAESDDPTLDLSEIKEVLALTAKSVALDVIELAQAAASTSADEEEISQAIALVVEGEVLLEAGDYRGAVDKFRDALGHAQSVLG